MYQDVFMQADGGGGGDLARDLLRAMRRRAGQRRFVPDGPVRRGPLHRPYRSEPLLLAELIEECVSDRGWVIPPLAALRGRWVEIVGPDLGRNLVPEGFSEYSGALHLVAASKAWATQVQFLEQQLLLRLRHELKGVAPTALRITVRGPSGGRLRATGPRPEEAAATVPLPRADPRPLTEEHFPATAEGGFEEAFPEAVYRDAASAFAAGADGADGAESGSVDRDELVRERLRERLARQRAEEERWRHGREDLLRLPCGWLAGPANLNPRPVPGSGRARWAGAVLASARLRAAADRAAGGAE
ncbi:DUF721 domain-containing protein (plasmid) [Kitasatospora purpeofusca]|uniref:DciA family protein n=1 Tax=Kitasatospora purpeofusca TaxID=67352 RepID=UPI002E0EF963|nr:DUF721 domain-containing protein [Kitasatospora purpeofusca]